MAFAPLKLRFPDLQIEHPEVVDKSFPEFWEQFDLVLENKL
jgi:5-enolpyruvylshikimate-3-phosphate synthase